MIKLNEQRPCETKNPENGFSVIEMAIGTLVMLILGAIAIPSIMQGWNSYRLTSAADSVAGILERTRFEAIHKNARLSCIGAPSGTGWTVGIDENGNGVIDPNEPQVILPGPATLVGAGVAPGPASMGAGYAGAITPPGNAMTFDARGTVFFAGPGGPATYIAYVGIPNQPTYGYRAVTITPMGQVKVWAASSTGSWIGQ
ncbi:MAG TPA: GspH/FimT family pseudopilin [Candidatus Acidoferrales bacterium]|nr:GspH/FimT family pseudopilin [Candidatus Acidoferrales bacterium]